MSEGLLATSPYGTTPSCLVWNRKLRLHRDCMCLEHITETTWSAAEPGAADLKLLAALEGGLEPEREPEGPTMMGREARELMLSGQGDKALLLFKVPGNPHRSAHARMQMSLRPCSWSSMRPSCGPVFASVLLVSCVLIAAANAAPV